MTRTREPRERRDRRKKEPEAYTFVRCPTFIRHAAMGGGIEEILCKVCGTVIAGNTELVTHRGPDRAGNIIEQRTRQFIRFQNYAELKMLFRDGSHHVTNGCTNCLSEGLDPWQMRELLRADVEYAPESYTEKQKKRVPQRVTVVARNTAGIP